MKLITQKARFSALITVTLCALSGCANAPKRGIESEAFEVKIYRGDQLLQSQYEHVRYLWTDSWRTAFSLPSASSEAEGTASLQAEAAKLGANGLINVSCMDQGRYWPPRSKEPSILCYGHAIRVR